MLILMNHSILLGQKNCNTLDNISKDNTETTLRIPISPYKEFLINKKILNFYSWSISWQNYHIYKIRIFTVTAMDIAVTVDLFQLH